MQAQTVSAFKCLCQYCQLPVIQANGRLEIAPHTRDLCPYTHLWLDSRCMDPWLCFWQVLTTGCQTACVHLPCNQGQQLSGHSTTVSIWC